MSAFSRPHRAQAPCCCALAPGWDLKEPRLCFLTRKYLSEDTQHGVRLVGWNLFTLPALYAILEILEQIQTQLPVVSVKRLPRLPQVFHERVVVSLRIGE